MSRGSGTQCLPPAPLVAAPWPRLLPAEAADGTVTSLREHLARHGGRPSCAGGWQRRQHLIGEVERAGLTGRGGAAFPTAVKLRALAAAARTPVVIANGVEGEPASDKDKVLLRVAPHLVIDGAVSAAELVGASEAVIVAHPRRLRGGAPGRRRAPAGRMRPGPGAGAGGGRGIHRGGGQRGTELGRARRSRPYRAPAAARAARLAGPP